MGNRKKGQTIFELMFVVLALFGIITEFNVGNHWGWLAAIAGAAMGGVAGFYMGYLPLIVTQWFFNRQCKRPH